MHSKVPKDVRRFFKEAKNISDVPPDRWMVPDRAPAPIFKMEGTGSYSKEKLVNKANSLLVAANHRAGDYSKVYYSYQFMGRRWDLEKKKKVSWAIASLLVFESVEKEKFLKN
jgi:hypothetical protein